MQHWWGLSYFSKGAALGKPQPVRVGEHTVPDAEAGWKAALETSCHRLGVFSSGGQRDRNPFIPQSRLECKCFYCLLSHLWKSVSMSTPSLYWTLLLSAQKPAWFSVQNYTFSDMRMSDYNAINLSYSTVKQNSSLLPDVTASVLVKIILF